MVEKLAVVAAADATAAAVPCFTPAAAGFNKGGIPIRLRRIRGVRHVHSPVVRLILRFLRILRQDNRLVGADYSSFTVVAEARH